ncbi:piriformospora indica-insensitive protein 2-like [Tripterygium wilfordii]|uniref:non-specific serine/threonine protein kinase n=1 Tax=Tripterygium wilfordii TaxID=458696 RepID=A0A7J7CY86_TRIWF|nr:piriformospora indica-insensitive protein 2-like [Tripterygium wilfordii]KAF5738978.1 piriformospora indica-insensitive protein 2-like [Tripterygium wilfordii]
MAPKFLFLISFQLFLFLVISQEQPLLDMAEQDSVYRVLESVNPTIPWRSIFPDDFCYSAPHGVVCDVFSEPNGSISAVHITELSFGYVSDFNPNPPCYPNSTFDPLLFTSFKYLRKLFFYKCFTDLPVSVSTVWPSFASSLEELIFIDNPALVGSLNGLTGNFTSLKRAVITGNGLSGNIPGWVVDSVNLEELTLSRNQLDGAVSTSFSKLKLLRILDLSQNQFDGNVPDSIANLTQLLKLDLSANAFSGKIPNILVNLQNMEFLDLSHNQFGNFGVPVFLSKMPRLRELHLNGNSLGGHIPEIWKNLGGIKGIGFSNMGLVGNIPASMGVYLRNLSYLGLDNNQLEGTVPGELGFLEFAGEINLENNNLSGRVPFTAMVGEILKLQGNPGLCVDDVDLVKNGSRFGHYLKLCNKTKLPNLVNPVLMGVASSSSLGLSLPSVVVKLIWVLVFFV